MNSLSKTSLIYENSIHKLICNSIEKKLKNIKLEQLQMLANNLEISLIKKKTDKDKFIKKNKMELINELNENLKNKSNSIKIDILKSNNIGIEIEVKDLLKIEDFDIDELIELNICLTLEKFLIDHPTIAEKFTNSCDLININNTIKSTNCIPCEVQGLYILTINKNDIDYIVKLGSFAESQGMYKRICSFGGGNYDTGSATNKWFQSFIKKAMEQNYTSKFTYYNKNQEKILIDDLDDAKIEMSPYVMRPLEAQLFKKYNLSNSNIPPIFGSNCL